tara:strand:+ start:9 stop:578 length:570 start_codon:yes stop_codon:yes gene_type:complete
MVETLKAGLLDKRTFACAFLAETIKLANQLWPQCTSKADDLELLQAVACFEEQLERLSTEVIQKLKGVPFKTLAGASRVKEISFKDEARKHKVLLVFVLQTGEQVLVCSRRWARLLHACYTALHLQKSMREAFLQQLGQEKDGFENSAIWAFMVTKYWKDFCQSVAIILDHSSLLVDLNVPTQEPREKK